MPPPTTLYEPEPFLGYSFTEEDKERFRRYGMDVQNALDAGGTPEEISEAAKSIERDEQFKVERAEHPVQQSRPVAVPPLEDPNFDVHGVPQQYEGFTDPERWKMRGDFSDVGTAMVQGLTSMVGSTVGFGLERAGEKFENQVLEGLGRSLKETANKYVQALGESMSAEGRASNIGSRDFLDTREGMEQAPWYDVTKYKPGSFNLDTILQTMGSAAGSSVMPLGAARVVGNGVQAVTKASPYVSGATGMFVGGGGLEGLSTASDVHDDAMRVPDEVIVKSPIFKAMSEEVLKEHPDAQGSQLIDFTRKQIANQAAYESGLYSGLGIGFTSIPVGGFLGKVGILAKPEAGFRKGFISSIISGSGREGVQEFIQEGGQQVAQNYGKYLIGESPEKWNFMGVPEAAVRGAVGGSGIGGVMGGVSRVATQADAPMAEMEEDVLREIDEETAAKEAQLEEEKELTDKAKVEEAKTKGKPQDQQVKDYEKETERASLINTKLSTLYKLREEGSLSRKAMNTSKLKWKQGDSFTKILKKNGFTEADVDAYGSPDTTFGIGDALESDEFILGEEKAPKATTTTATTTATTTPPKGDEVDEVEETIADIDAIAEGDEEATTTATATPTATPTVTAPTGKPVFKNKADQKEYNSASTGLGTNQRNLKALEKKRSEATDPEEIKKLDEKIVAKKEKIKQSEKRVADALAKGTVPEVAPAVETTEEPFVKPTEEVYEQEGERISAEEQDKARATTPPKFDAQTDKNFAKALTYFDEYYDRTIEKNKGSEQAVIDAASKLTHKSSSARAIWKDKLPKGVQGPKRMERGITAGQSLTLLERLGGNIYDAKGEKVKKQETWKRIFTIVQANKPVSGLRTESETGELEVAATRGKTRDRKESDIVKAAKSVTMKSKDPAFLAKYEKLRDELEEKASTQELDNREKLQLEVVKRGVKEHYGKDVGRQIPELETRKKIIEDKLKTQKLDAKGIKALKDESAEIDNEIKEFKAWEKRRETYLSDKESRKTLAEKVRKLRYRLDMLFRPPITGGKRAADWNQLFDETREDYNPAVAELYTEWLIIESLHSKVEKAPDKYLDKNGNVIDIYRVQASDIIHKKLQKLLVKRNKAFATLHNSRTNKEMELETEYLAKRREQLEKAGKDEKTLAEAWEEINRFASNQKLALRKYWKEQVPKALAAEEEFVDMALENDIDVEMFKNDLVDITNVQDLHLDNLEVAKEVRELTNTFNLMYRDGAYIGQAGANVQAGRVVFPEAREDSESWMKQSGFNVGDVPATKADLKDAYMYSQMRETERVLADAMFTKSQRKEMLSGVFIGEPASVGVDYEKSTLIGQAAHNLRIDKALADKKITKEEADHLRFDITQEQIDSAAEAERDAIDRKVTEIRLMAEKLGIDPVTYIDDYSKIKGIADPTLPHDDEATVGMDILFKTPLVLTGVTPRKLKVTSHKPTKISFKKMPKNPSYTVEGGGETTEGLPNWFRFLGKTDESGRIITGLNYNSVEKKWEKSNEGQIKKEGLAKEGSMAGKQSWKKGEAGKQQTRSVASIINPMKLGITEVEGVKTIEIIMDNDTDEGVLIGIINVATEDMYQDDYTGYEVTEKKYKMGEIIDATFNATARNKYNITNDSLNDVLVHALGTSVLATAQPHNTAKFHKERDAIGRALREMDLKFTNVGDRRLAHNYFRIAYIHELSVADPEVNEYGLSEKHFKELRDEEARFMLAGELEPVVGGNFRLDWLETKELLYKRKPKELRRVVTQKEEELPKGVQGPLRILDVTTMETEEGLTPEQRKEKEYQAKKREVEQKQTGRKDVSEVLMPTGTTIALASYSKEDHEEVKPDKPLKSLEGSSKEETQEWEEKLAKGSNIIALDASGNPIITEEEEALLREADGKSSTQKDIDGASDKASEDNQGCDLNSVIKDMDDIAES